MNALIATGMVASFPSPGERVRLIAATGAYVVWRDDDSIFVMALFGKVIEHRGRTRVAAASSGRRQWRVTGRTSRPRFHLHRVVGARLKPRVVCTDRSRRGRANRAQRGTYARQACVTHPSASSRRAQFA